MVRAGIMAARQAEHGPEVIVYDTDGQQQVASAYQTALKQGARVVIGPLTRSAVAGIVPLVKAVPTLALNALDGLPPRPQLYSLSLAADHEARQSATDMRAAGIQRPLVVTGPGGLDARLAADGVHPTPAGYAVMAPLAATSSNAAIRRLGGRRWQALHRAIYPIAVLGCVHFWWLVKKDITEPLIYAVITAALLGIRAWWREQERRKQLAGGYLPQPPRLTGKVIRIFAK